MNVKAVIEKRGHEFEIQRGGGIWENGGQRGKGETI